MTISLKVFDGFPKKKKDSLRFTLRVFKVVWPEI